METPSSLSEEEEIWQRFDSENEAVFWKDYEQLLQKAHATQVTHIQRFRSHYSSENKSSYLNPEKSLAITFESSEYLPWVISAYRVVAFGVFFLVLIFIPPFFWFVLMIALILDFTIKNHQNTQLIYKVYPDRLVIGNRKIPNKHEHLWSDIGNIELIRINPSEKNSLYKLVLTDVNQKPFKYLYDLGKTDHQAFFEQLTKRVPLVNETTPYLN